MHHGEPDLFLLDGALTAKVVFAMIEEEEWISTTVERQKIQLVQACVPHRPLLVEIEYLRPARTENLLLAELEAGQSRVDDIEGLHLLQQAHHQLAELLVFFHAVVGA
jgi:hypothetical protein